MPELVRRMFVACQFFMALVHLQAFLLDQLVVPAARGYGLEAEYKYLRPSIKQFPTGG